MSGFCFLFVRRAPKHDLIFEQQKEVYHLYKREKGITGVNAHGPTLLTVVAGSRKSRSPQQVAKAKLQGSFLLLVVEVIFLFTWGNRTFRSYRTTL